MKKRKVGTYDLVPRTMATLSSHGALLIAGAEIVNPMTIGWGQIGIAWGKPVFLIMVRQSRYTHELLDQANDFSVNLPPESMQDVCMLCGSKSGRNTDKVEEAGLTVQPGRSLDVPTLLECPIHYECQIVHQSEMDPDNLADNVRQTNYRSDDYHTIYWGEIVGVYKRV